MEPSLKILAELRQGKALLRALGGRLDETMKPSLLDPGAGCEFLVLDLEGVTHVTSFGVREWIRVLKPLSQKHKLYFVRASPRMTDQFNMVVGFDAGGTLLSFRAFYVCSHCQEETAVLFDNQLDQKTFETLVPPIYQCTICGHNAELDDDPAVLFEYARSCQFQPPPAEVLQVFRHLSSWIFDLPGVRLGMRQTVQEQHPVIRLVGMIDGPLPVRRIVEVSESQVTLVLDRVVFFADTAFGSWRDMMGQLMFKRVLLEGVPPVVLRRFIDDPILIGNAEITALSLPVRCEKCHSTGWSRVAFANLQTWLDRMRERTGICRVCGGCVGLVGNPGQILPIHDAIKQAKSATPEQAKTTKINIPQAMRKDQTPRLSGAPDSIQSNYEILCKIGQGGMAELFLARQRKTAGFGKLAVIKSIRSDLVTDDKLVRLFLDEARLASRIDHTNVVRMYDLGRGEKSFLIVMEYVHGRSLAQTLREMRERNEHVPPAVALALIADLCAALACAHVPDVNGKSLIHRDVTPGNVLISFAGVVKLVDFGLAGYARMHKNDDKPKHIMGSAPYVPPELYLGKEAVPQSDLWGVTLLLYIMLTGENPFYRRELQEMALAIVREPIKRYWSKIPWRINRIIKKGLMKAPEQRFESAMVMEKAIRAILPKISGEYDTMQWIRRIFAGQMRLENEFSRRHKSQTLIDALLIAEPKEVEKFFRAMRSNSASLTNPSLPDLHQPSL